MPLSVVELGTETAANVPLRRREQLQALLQKLLRGDDADKMVTRRLKNLVWIL